MTKVSVPSSSGETVRSRESGSARIRRSANTAVALAGRYHRSRAVPGTEPFTPLAVPRFERSAEPHQEDWGHAVCLVGR